MQLCNLCLNGLTLGYWQSNFTPASSAYHTIVLTLLSYISQSIILLSAAHCLIILELLIWNTMAFYLFDHPQLLNPGIARHFTFSSSAPYRITFYVLYFGYRNIIMYRLSLILILHVICSAHCLIFFNCQNMHSFHYTLTHLSFIFSFFQR